MTNPPSQSSQGGFGGKAVTTRGPGYVKPFSFSYSKIKNFETCPKRYYHVDFLPKGHPDKVREEDSEQLQWGNIVHKSLAEAISNGEEKPLPKTMTRYQGWVDKMVTGRGNPNVRILVEQQLAIDENFGPTSWFDSDALRKGLMPPWYRGIGDVIKIVGPVALVVDWKTGKILEDSQQLALMAACVFAHYPEVMKVRSEFVWLMHDAETRKDFHRNDMPEMWRHLWPRIEALKNAHNTITFPTKPSGLCGRYCPVRSCPENGANR